MSELPKVVKTGEFNLYGVTVKCHVLDNGRRVLEDESLALLFERMGDCSGDYKGDIEAFCKWAKDF